MFPYNCQSYATVSFDSLLYLTACAMLIYLYKASHPREINVSAPIEKSLNSIQQDYT